MRVARAALGITTRLALTALLVACSVLPLQAQDNSTDEEDKQTFRPIFDFLLREEPGISVSRKDSLLNPDDILGMPRLQNRVLASFDAKIPIVGGNNVNPIAELVVANTFVYLQHEGSEPTLAKQQIADYRNFLKEFYFNVRPTGNFLLTLGRRNLTDGVGYSRNPVDFLANPSTLPGANFDNRFRLRNREGSIIARGEYLWKGGAVSYTYVPQLGPSDATDHKLRTEIDRLTQFNRSDAHWAKVYQLVAGYDLSLHYFYRQRHNIGLAVAKVFGDALELHAEGRTQRGSSVLTPYKRSEDVYIGPTLVQPALYDFEARPGETWYARVLVGGQYTFENKLNLSTEYFYNGEGYSASQLATYANGLELAGSRYANSTFVLPAGNPYRLFLLAANQNFNFLSMGQHYVFMRLADPEFFGSNKWEAAVYASTLVTDGSGLAAGDLTYRINDRFSLQFLVNGFFGTRRSEGGLFYQGMSALMALEAQF
ncbi:MAG: hypothetical protein U1F40_01660 [Turneriella sp.]